MSAQAFGPNFQEDVVAAMEEKDAPNLDATDGGCQLVAKSDQTDVAAICGDGARNDGRATLRVSSPDSHLCPPVSWLEFKEWLERRLDDSGLEPSLYARCVLSILKQQPEPATDMHGDQDEHWLSDTAANFLSAIRHKAGKNVSAPPSRKNSVGSLTCAITGVASNTKADRDARKQALLDCLKTANGDEADLKRFVDDIVERYTSACGNSVTGEKQNESVDSGVCPSPEESFQNYDEAFPPLAGDGTNDVCMEEEIAEIRPRGLSVGWYNGKRPAQDNAKSMEGRRANPGSRVDGDDSMQVSTQGDASPIKRPKLLLKMPESDNVGRSLHSCPDFVQSPGFTVDGQISNEKRATFCCPIVKKQNGNSTSVGSKIPPQFVVPKCWKVGSWPSRYDRAIKPAGDVPFWSCSEWFCTVHKRLEFGLLNAKINGDTKSLAPPPAASIAFQAVSSTNENGLLEPSTDQFVDADIFEIESSLPPPSAQPQQQQQQHGWNYERNERQLQDELEKQAQTVPDMFDAPRFILHIISEDEKVPKEEYGPQEKQQGESQGGDRIKSNWTPFFEVSGNDALYSSQKTSFGQYDGPSWTPCGGQPDFVFDALVDACGSASTTSGNVVPMDISRSNADVGFCMPKCGPYPSLAQQQRQQAFAAPSNTTTGLFNKILDSDALENASQKEKASGKLQPQSVAVPITEKTHFIPIRSESMEDAYYLKPGFDDFCAAIENLEDYYVYHQPVADGPIVVTAATTATSSKKSLDGNARRSLALKFRASNPDKTCQTEVEELAYDLDAISPDCDNRRRSSTLLDNHWYSQEHLWAYDPTECDNSSNSNKWPGDNSGALDGMVVGTLSPHVDDGWTTRSRVDSMTLQQEHGDGQQLEMELEKDATSHDPQSDPKDDQQRLEIWQQEDERYEDSLLRYVSNISLISPLDVRTTIV